MLPSTHSVSPFRKTWHPWGRSTISLTRFFFTSIGRHFVPFLLLAVLLSFTFAERVYAQADPGCAAGACVSSGTRLTGANSSDSELLNALLGSMFGIEINVSLVDWQALASAGVTLDELQTALEAGTPEALLAEPITLGELLAALNTINGLTDLQAIDALTTAVGNLPNANEQLILGDLLHIQSGAGAFSAIDLNALDLVIGSIQLFNAESIGTTPEAITINGSALGLEEIGEITIQAQVIDPPVLACGPTGTQFYSAGVRVKLGLEILDLSLGASPLGFNTVDVALQLSALDVYLDVARGSGILQTINAITRAVTVQATPGITDIYVGTIDDNVFFSSTPLNPASVTPGIVGSLTISLPVLIGSPNVVNVPDITIKSYAEGTSASQTLNFTGDPAGSGSYPQTLTASAGTTVVTTYTTDLLTNLEISANLTSTIDSLLGGLGSTIIDPLLLLLGIGDILDLTAPVVALVEDTLLPDLLEPLLNTALSEIVDPLLGGLGIGLGEMDITVLGVTQACPALRVSKSHTGSFAAGGTGQYTILVTNTGTYTTQFPITVIDTLPTGLSYNSHSPVAWVRQGNTTTFVNSTPLGPGSAAPPLILTVNVAANAPGVVFNKVTGVTTGNVGGTDSQASDRTVITGSSDNDGDGTPDDPDPDDNDPCIPDNTADNCDRDGDGLTNGEEQFYGTDPDNPDTDGDDGNGFDLSDGEEVNGNPPSDPLDPCDPNPNATTCDPDAVDSDGDKVPDDTDSAPNDPCVPNPNAAVCDRDEDGLNNREENEHNTDPDNPDTDGDGLNDGSEVNRQPPSDPLDPCDPDDQVAACDRDNDGLTNGEEAEAGTDLDNADTDNDGILDGADIGPLDPCVPNANADACTLFNVHMYAPTIEVTENLPPGLSR